MTKQAEFTMKPALLGLICLLGACIWLGLGVLVYCGSSVTC